MYVPIPDSPCQVPRGYDDAVRAGRLVSILMLLQLRVRLTAEALAEELEVSVRTIYRDIEALSEAGVPIYGDRGPGGGFQLLDGYRTKLTGLAAPEAEAVFMIGLPEAAEAMGLGPAAAEAGRKLLASLPPPLSEGAGRLGARFHFDPAEWYRQVAPPPHLPLLARAVLDARTVTMTYESWTSVKSRRVEPLGLVLKAATWYLVAQRDGVARIYRVSGVHALEVHDDVFTRPERFDLPAFWSEAIARFEAELRPARATVRASAIGRERLRRAGAYAAAAVREATELDADDWAVVSLPIEHVDDAAHVILAAGGEVVVVDPPELAARVHALATAILRRHPTGTEPGA